MRLLWALSAFFLLAADWPRYRGPNGSGVGDVKNLPVEFSPTKNVAWKLNTPLGHSSPVLINNRIFLTGFDDKRLLTFAVDADSGKLLWERELPRTRKATHGMPANNGAAPSVAADGKHVAAFFEDFGLVGYTADGKELWRVPLGPFQSFFGIGASPILIRDTVVMVCDGDANTFIIAIDAATGKVKWRRERAPANSFTTPLVFDGGKDGTQLIIFGGRQLLTYSLATGEPLWWLNNMPLRPKSSPFLATAKDGTPLLMLSAQTPGEDPTRRDYGGLFSKMVELYGADDKGRVSLQSIAQKNKRDLQTPTMMDTNADGFVTEEEFNHHEQAYSSPNIVGAVRLGPGLKGDIESRVAWRRDRFVPNTPTPVVYQGILYVVKEGGILSTFDAETGEPFKQGRIKGAIESYLASPVAGDGKLYTVSDAGHMAVIKPGRDWEILAVNDLDEPTAATPALDNGRIFVRTKEHLYCFKQAAQ